MAHLEDGNANALFVCSAEKKNVFLIGDSIRMGYCAAVRAALSDLAEVFYVDDNCRNTQYVITNLQAWSNLFSDPAKVDVVQFNCGHWDIAHWIGDEMPLTSETEYVRNIRMIIRLIRTVFPNAKIAFATTTPMNPNGQMGGNPRTTAEIACYNELAKTVAAEENVPIFDLFDAVKDWDTSCYTDYCHYTPAAKQMLGEIVADSLKALISEK